MLHRPNFYLPGTRFILSFIGKWPGRVRNWRKWITYNPKDLGTKNGKQTSWISGGEEYAGVSCVYVKITKVLLKNCL